MLSTWTLCRGVMLMATFSSLLAPQKPCAHTALLSPNGGESLVATQPFTIEWTVAVAHQLENWDLWYSLTSSDGPWIDIAMNCQPGTPTRAARTRFHGPFPT